MSSTIAINEPSIFISHVFPNKADMVYDTFAELFGAEYIDDVDVVKHEFNGQEICRVYIHFKKWPTTTEFQRLRSRLMNGDTVKIVYDEPWYWKCVASKLPRITSKGSMTAPPKKRIVLDEKSVASPVVPPVVSQNVVVETTPLSDETSTETQATEETTETQPEETQATETWADKVKQPQPEVIKAKTSLLDETTMMAVNYEYCSYTRGLNLKTKEDFRNYIGDIIFRIVVKISPIFGNKITGMILELEPSMIVRALEDKDLFNKMVIDCYTTLQEAIASEMSQLMSK